MTLLTQNIKILYYIEENEIVIHCPQLDIALVEDFNFELDYKNDSQVVTLFKNALDKRILRYEGAYNFLQHLRNHNHFNTENNIKTLDYFIDTFPYLKRTLNTPNIRTLEHEIVLND